MVASIPNAIDGCSCSPSSYKVDCNESCISNVDEPTQVRKVQFGSRVNCRRFYISASEKADRWYSPTEMRSRKQRDKHLQSQICEGEETLWGDDDPESMLVFGLRTVKETKLRRRLVKESKASILEEQAFQEELFLSGVEDDDLDHPSFSLDQGLIEKCYAKFSKHAALLAYMRGMQNSRQVEESLDEGPENDSSKHSKWDCGGSNSSDKPKCSPRPGFTSTRNQHTYILPVRRRIGV